MSVAFSDKTLKFQVFFTYAKNNELKIQAGKSRTFYTNVFPTAFAKNLLLKMIL